MALAAGREGDVLGVDEHLRRLLSGTRRVQNGSGER